MAKFQKPVNHTKPAASMRSLCSSAKNDESSKIDDNNNVAHNLPGGSGDASVITAREYLPHLFWMSGDADERREHRHERFRSLLEKQHATEENYDAKQFFQNFAQQSRTEAQLLNQLKSINSLRSHLARVVQERQEELDKREKQRQWEASEQQRMQLELGRNIADDVKMQDLQWFETRADAVRDAETELISKTCIDSVLSLAEVAMSYSAYQDDIVTQASIPSPILEDLWTLFLTGGSVEKFENYLRLMPTVPTSTASVTPGAVKNNLTHNTTDQAALADASPAAGKHASIVEDARSGTAKKETLSKPEHSGNIKPPSHSKSPSAAAAPKLTAKTAKDDDTTRMLENLHRHATSETSPGNNMRSPIKCSSLFAQPSVVDLEVQDFMRYLNRSGPWSAAAAAATIPTADALSVAKVSATNVTNPSSLQQQQPGTLAGTEQQQVHALTFAEPLHSEQQNRPQQLPNGGSGLTTRIFDGLTPGLIITGDKNAAEAAEVTTLKNDLLGKFITDLVNFRRKPITPPDHIAAPTAPIKIAILGKPLSGKTLLSRYLSHVYGFQILNMQKLAQSVVLKYANKISKDEEDDDITTATELDDGENDEQLKVLGELVRSELYSGSGLNPTTAAALVLDAMKNRPTSGWILDGFPDTLTQARVLQRELNGFDVEKVQESYERQTSVLAGDQEGVEMPKLLTELLDLVIVLDLPDAEIAERVSGKLYPTPTKADLLSAVKLSQRVSGGEAENDREESLVSVLKRLEGNALEYNALHDRITSFGTEYKKMEPVLMEFSCNVVHVDGRRTPEELFRRVDSLISARIQARVDAYMEPAADTSNAATVKSDFIIKSQLELPAFNPTSYHSSTKYPPLKIVVVQSKPGDNTCRRGVCDEEFETLRRKGIRRRKQQHQQQQQQQAIAASTAQPPAVQPRAVENATKLEDAGVVSFPVDADNQKSTSRPTTAGGSPKTVDQQPQKSSRNSSKRMSPKTGQQSSVSGAERQSQAATTTAKVRDGEAQRRRGSVDRLTTQTNPSNSTLSSPQNNSLSPQNLLKSQNYAGFVPLTMASPLDDGDGLRSQITPMPVDAVASPAILEEMQPPVAATFEEIRRLLNYTSDQDSSAFELSDTNEEAAAAYEGEAREQKANKLPNQSAVVATNAARSDSPRLANNNNVNKTTADTATKTATASGAKAPAAAGGKTVAAPNETINNTKATVGSTPRKTDGNKNNKTDTETAPASNNMTGRSAHAAGRAKIKLFLTHCLAEPDPLATDSSSVSSFSEDELDSSEYDCEDDFYTAFVQHDLRRAPQQVEDANALCRALSDGSLNANDYNRSILGFYHRQAEGLERWRAERDSVRQSRAKRKHDVMRYQSEADPAVRLAAYYTAHKRRRKESAFFPDSVRIPTIGDLASLSPEFSFENSRSAKASSPTMPDNNIAVNNTITIATPSMDIAAPAGVKNTARGAKIAHIAEALPNVDTNRRESRASQQRAAAAEQQRQHSHNLSSVDEADSVLQPDTRLTSLSYELDSARGSQLLQLWSDIEAHYLSTTMRIFSEQRKVYRDIMIESYRLRSQFVQILLVHQHQLRHPIFRYQARFNGIAAWQRARSEYKAWMHHDVDNCSDLLRETSDISRRKALGVLFDIKSSGWLEDRLGLVVNACVELAQAELEFVVGVAFLLREYFNSLCGAAELVDSEVVGVGGYANVPIVDLIAHGSARAGVGRGVGGSESWNTAGVPVQTAGVHATTTTTASSNAAAVSSAGQTSSSANDGGKGGLAAGKDDAKSTKKDKQQANSLAHTQSAHNRSGKNNTIAPVQEVEIQIATVPRKLPPHLTDRPNITALLASSSASTAPASSAQQTGTSHATTPATASSGMTTTPAAGANTKPTRSQNRLSATGAMIGPQIGGGNLNFLPGGEQHTGAAVHSDSSNGSNHPTTSTDGNQTSRVARDHNLGDAEEQMIDEASAAALELLRQIAANEIDGVINRSNAHRKAVFDEAERIKREKTMPPPAAKGGKKSGAGGAAAASGGGKADKHAKEKEKAAAAAAAAVDPPAVVGEAADSAAAAEVLAEDPVKVRRHANLVALLTQKYEACLRPAVVIAAHRIRAIQAYARGRVAEVKQIMRQMYNHFDYLLERQHQRETNSLRKIILHLHACVETEQCLGQLVRIDAGNVQLDHDRAWPLGDHSNAQPDREADLYKPRPESKFDTNRLLTHFGSIADADTSRLSFSDVLQNFVHVAHCRYNTQLVQLNHTDQAAVHAWHLARTNEYEKVAYECFRDRLVSAPEGVDTIVPEVSLQSVDARLESAIKRMTEFVSGTDAAAGGKPGAKNNAGQRDVSLDGHD